MIFVIYIVCLAAIIYFLLILPQQKRKKHHARLITSLKTGMEVVTVGGFHGTVTELTSKTVILEAKDGSVLEFDSMAIAKICGMELKK